MTAALLSALDWLLPTVVGLVVAVLAYLRGKRAAEAKHMRGRVRSAGGH